MTKLKAIFISAVVAVLCMPAQAQVVPGMKTMKLPGSSSITADIFRNIDFSGMSSNAAAMEMLSKLPTIYIPPEEAQKVLDEFSERFSEYIITSYNSLPRKYWQYMVPALYASPFMPKKVLEYPDFLPYKGKKPTDIAPQMKEYAAKYLDYMSPQLYPVLMPEMWEKPENDWSKISPKEAIDGILKDAPREHEPRFDFGNPKDSIPEIAKVATELDYKKFASGEYKNEKPDTGRSKEMTENTPLKGGDVIAVISSMEEVVPFMHVDRTIKQRKIMENYKDFFKYMDNFSESAKVEKNPCQRFVKEIDPAIAGEFEKSLTRQGFNNPSEWAVACDKTIKAARLAQLDVNEAYGIQDLRVRKDIILDQLNLTDEMRKVMQNRIDGVLGLYDGKVEDVPAVRANLPKLRGVTGSTGFLGFLNTSL